MRLAGRIAGEGAPVRISRSIDRPAQSPVAGGPFRPGKGAGDPEAQLRRVAFLDLDGFKAINDAIGHTAADRLLQQVASRLSSCVRSSDTACRYGGDELVVLLPDIDRPEQAAAACEKIRRELALPYVIDGTPIRATASLGMATFPTDGTDCFELIQSADLSMYREKGKKPSRPAGQSNGEDPSADRDCTSSPLTSPSLPFVTP